jgi:hypothetical protein
MTDQNPRFARRLRLQAELRAGTSTRSSASLTLAYRRYTDPVVAAGDLRRDGA